MASEAGAHRAPPDDPVAGEVFERELAATLAHGRDDRLRAPSAVDDGRAAARNRLQRVRELGQAKGVACDEALAVRPAVDPAAFGSRAQDRVEQRM